MTTVETPSITRRCGSGERQTRNAANLMEERMAWLHDNGDEEELAFDDEEDGEKEGTVEEETEEVIVTERMGAPVAAPPLPVSGKSKPKPKSKAKPKAKPKAKAKAKPKPKKKPAAKKKAAKGRKKR